MKVVHLVLLLVIVSNLSKGQVEFIAHRGASYLAPENTIASDKLAWELGADAVELDIHLSKDNKVMVIHDGDTKKVSGKYYRVSDTNSDVLRTLDIGSFKGEKYKGEKIPFLSEMIDLVPKGKKLVVELKSREETIPWLKQVVEQSGKLDQLIFICFDWKTILTTKRTFPENTCYWLCNDKSELLKKIRDVAKFGLEGVDLKHSIIDQEVMDKANKYHLDLVAYTINDPKEVERLIQLGVKGITTDRPAWLKKQVYASENDTLRYSKNGTFKIVHYGYQLIIDEGHGTYTAKTFSDKRYEIWSNPSDHHNVPTILSFLQIAGEEHRAGNMKGRSYAQLWIDLSGVYPKEAGINYWNREIWLNRRKDVELVDMVSLDTLVISHEHLLTCYPP